MLSKHRKTAPVDAAPDKASAASQAPAFSIPVEPLGFYAPGPYYLGQRESLVSLDFLDENHLLFTFRAPGLIHRSNPADDEERQIRAQVLALPQGTPEAEALWTLHDHERYLWILRNGHFLLRDSAVLKEGDAKLDLKPWLQFPGPVLSVQLDPEQQLLVTNSREPADRQPKPGEVNSSPAAAVDSQENDPSENTGQRDFVLRILERNSGKVMLVSRLRGVAQLPVSADGYLESLRGSGKDWVLNLNYFTGGSKIVGRVESSCQPPLTFVSRKELLANTCALDAGRNLVAISTVTGRLWAAPSPPTQIWPILVLSPDGSRIARETLTVDHSIEDFGHSLDASDIKGQLVEVFDSKSGKLLLKAQASPVLDGGGNVALSPSGKRVAILNAGAIDVYELSELQPAAETPGPARPSPGNR